MLVSARGVEFEVRVGGPEDGPAVLLLHGFPQHGGMWDAVTPALHAQGLRTYAPDQRGYSAGTLDSDVDSFRMPNLIADVVALLDALELSTVDLVGHDWGATVGWHLSASHAERVRTFTALSVPHPRALGRARHVEGSDQKERSEYMFLFAQEGTAERYLLEDDAQRLWGLFEPLSREQCKSYVDPLLRPGALTAALNWYRRLEKPVLGPALVPVTYVWGEQDWAMGPLAAAGCADFVAPGLDYRFVPLSGISHWIVDQEPELVTREILARIGRAS